MEPQMHINVLHVACAALAAFVVGFLWFGPLFGKAWAREMKMPPDFKPTSGQMARGMILAAVGALLTSYVLAHSVEVWRPSTWNAAGTDAPPHIYGFFAAFFTWLGFYVPMRFNNVAWEGKSWKLFSINAAGDFVTLQAVAMILSFWR